jgi:hypothetical protein
VDQPRGPDAGGYVVFSDTSGAETKDSESRFRKVEKGKFAAKTA